MRIVYSLTIAIILLARCGSPYNPTTEDLKALEEIKQEPKVREALITDAKVLYASVEDDGTPRDGYAEYLCQVLKEHKSQIVQVKIVKVNSTNDPDRDNDYGVLLGQSLCN